MNADPDRSDPAALRPVRILEIVALVLFWNGAYKGARVLVTLHALELGASPLHTGVLLAAYALFPLLLAVYAGRLSDAYGVRVPVTGGMAVCALGVALPYAWPALPMLYAAAALTGAGFIMVQVSLQSLTGSLGGGAARTRNFNLYALAVATADFVGPVMAGLSIDHLGHVRSYLFLGLFGFAGVLLLLVLAPRLPRGAGGGDRGALRMTDLLRERDLRRVFVASAVVMAGVDLFQLYLPLYGHAVGLSATAIGLVLGACAAATFVTRALIPALVRRYGEERTLLRSMLLTAAMFLLVPFTTDALVLGAICFVLGLGMGLGQPLTVMLAYNYSPAGRAGEALGLRIAINNIMHVAVPPLFGAVGSLVGLAPVFWANAACIALGGYASRRRGG
jgi:MFS family permease